MIHNKGVFMVGGGAAITFQLRTIAEIPDRRRAEAQLKQMTNMVQDDIMETFDNEGAIGRHDKWMALSPSYAKRKRSAKGGGGSRDRILQLDGNLERFATGGELRVIRAGKRYAIGYKMDKGAEKVAHYALLQYFGSSAVGRKSSKLSKTKVRKGRKGFRGAPLAFQEKERDGRVPGRPYIRLTEQTEEKLGIGIRDIWAEQNVNTYLKKAMGV